MGEEKLFFFWGGGECFPCGGFFGQKIHEKGVLLVGFLDFGTGFAMRVCVHVNSMFEYVWKVEYEEIGGVWFRRQDIRLTGIHCMLFATGCCIVGPVAHNMYMTTFLVMNEIEIAPN